MTVTISRLYNTYPDAQAAINRLEAAGVKHGDISVLASNADGWYKAGETGKPGTFPDRDLDGKDDRAEAAGAGAGIGAVTGGALGALTGLGLMAIPGVGPIVAAGWLVATSDGCCCRRRNRRRRWCSNPDGRELRGSRRVRGRSAARRRGRERSCS